MVQNVIRARLIELFGSDFISNRYVVGVSGGPDSIVLFHAVRNLIPKERLTVAHFNHGTRGEESEGDESFVRSLAKESGTGFVCQARKGTSVSEAALRTERLEFLTACAKRKNAYVLLAHHLDDQLETFLFRLIRGTSLKGLMGMRLKNGRVLRPLLGVPKSELMKYMDTHGLSYRWDRTNEQMHYFRNRIRHELSPPLFELAKAYGGTVRFYDRFSNLVKESQILIHKLERQYDKWLQRGLIKTGFFYRLELRSVPPKILISGDFLRRLLETVDLKQADRTSIENLQSLLARTSGKVSLLGDVTAEISCGYLYLQSKEQRQRWSDGIEFHTKGQRVSALALGFSAQIPVDGKTYRTFRPGDRFGGRKLKEVYLRRGIPRLERALSPVLLCKKTSNILWFLGHSKGLPEGVSVRFPFAALTQK